MASMKKTGKKGQKSFDKTFAKIALTGFPSDIYNPIRPETIPVFRNIIKSQGKNNSKPKAKSKYRNKDRDSKPVKHSNGSNPPQSPVPTPPPHFSDQKSNDAPSIVSMSARETPQGPSGFSSDFGKLTMAKHSANDHKSNSDDLESKSNDYAVGYFCKPCKSDVPCTKKSALNAVACVICLKSHNETISAIAAVETMKNNLINLRDNANDDADKRWFNCCACKRLADNRAKQKRIIKLIAQAKQREEALLKQLSDCVSERKNLSERLSQFENPECPDVKTEFKWFGLKENNQRYFEQCVIKKTDEIDQYHTNRMIWYEKLERDVNIVQPVIADRLVARDCDISMFIFLLSFFIIHIQTLFFFPDLELGGVCVEVNGMMIKIVGLDKHLI